MWMPIPPCASALIRGELYICQFRCYQNLGLYVHPQIYWNLGHNCQSTLLYINGLSRLILTISQALCSQCLLEQMYEEGEATMSSVARKRKRRSGFRFSSRKVLERSRAKRETSRVEGFELESVTKELLFSCEISDSIYRESSPKSSLPTCLDSVVEVEGDGLEMTERNADIFEASNRKVWKWIYHLWSGSGH